MATVFDVAKYILKKQGKMSTWKLQKLCYYAQAGIILGRKNASLKKIFKLGATALYAANFLIHTKESSWLVQRI